MRSAEDLSEDTSPAEASPGLPRANLQVVSLQRLLQGDATEDELLFSICRTSGFFYLDLHGISGLAPRDIGNIFDFERRLFGLPQEELNSFDVDKLSKLKLNGYKPLGRNYGGIDGKDGFETYGLPKNGIMELGRDIYLYPALVTQNMVLLRNFTEAMMEAYRTIFTSLSKSLLLSAGHALQDYHRPDLPSPDILRLLRYHAQRPEQHGNPHAAHTDMGSLSFVFSHEPGLQIIEPGSNTWSFVAPKPGCAVVNLGDAVSMLTNGLLHSCLHRVGPLPGRAMPERYSIAYLVRPEDRTVLSPMESPLIPRTHKTGVESVMTAKQWIERKFGVLRADTRDQKEVWVMTGARSSTATR